MIMEWQTIETALKVLRNGYANELAAYAEQKSRGDLTEMGIAAMWKTKRFVQDLDRILALPAPPGQP